MLTVLTHCCANTDGEADVYVWVLSLKWLQDVSEPVKIKVSVQRIPYGLQVNMLYTQAMWTGIYNPLESITDALVRSRIIWDLWMQTVLSAVCRMLLGTTASWSNFSKKLYHFLMWTWNATWIWTNLTACEEWSAQLWMASFSSKGWKWCHIWSTSRHYDVISPFSKKCLCETVGNSSSNCNQSGRKCHCQTVTYLLWNTVKNCDPFAGERLHQIVNFRRKTYFSLKWLHSCPPPLKKKKKRRQKRREKSVLLVQNILLIVQSDTWIQPTKLEKRIYSAHGECIPTKIRQHSVFQHRWFWDTSLVVSLVK